MMALQSTRDPKEFGRVAVLFGGRSAEREVSSSPALPCSPRCRRRVWMPSVSMPVMTCCSA